MAAADRAIIGVAALHYESTAAVVEAVISPARNYLRTWGYAAPGDGGGALYRKAGSEPSHPGKVRSADGAWWEIVPFGGVVDIRQLGAKVDGVAHDEAAVEDALKVSEALNAPVVHFPAGTTLISFRVDGRERTRSLMLRGVGRASVIKRADDAIDADYDRLILIRNASGSEINVEIRDLFLDGNARRNGIPHPISGVSGTFQVDEAVTGATSGNTGRVTKVFADTLGLTNLAEGQLTTGETLTGGTSGATATLGTAPSTYIYQHTGIIDVSPNDMAGIRSLVIENVEAYDPTADVISMLGTSNGYSVIQINKFRSRGRERTRSDLTITAPYDRLSISNVLCDDIEWEPNSASPSHRYQTVLTNVVTQRNCALVGVWGGAADVARFEASNLICRGKVEIARGIGHISNFDFILDEDVRIVEGRWRFTNGRFYFTSSHADAHGIYYLGGGTQPEHLVFENIEFDRHGSAAIAEYVYDPGVAIGDEPHVFRNCRFLGTDVRTATIANGMWRFEDCWHEYAGDCIRQSSPGSTRPPNQIWLYGNRVASLSGYLYRPPDGGSACEVWMKGNTHVQSQQGQLVLLDGNNIGNIAAPRGSGTGVMFREVDDAELSAAPTAGSWLRGQRIWRTDPAVGGSMGWVCITTGNVGGSAGFRAMPHLVP